MQLPPFKVGSIDRRKVPAADIIEQDASTLVESIAVYNENPVELENGDVSLPQVDKYGNIKVNNAVNLVPFAYDYISVGYTGNNITSVVYKTGGSSGTVVATLTIAYTGSKIISVTRT